MNKGSENIVRLPSREQIEREAAEWIAALGAEDFTADKRAKFHAWLSQSERHRDAFKKLEKVWQDMALLQDLRDIGQADQQSPNQTRTLIQRREFVAAAASFAVLAIGGGGVWMSGALSPYDEGVYRTAVGKSEDIRLSDGSTIKLNTNSELKVSFTDGARNIQMLKGEAFFSVAKDPKRPFIVSTDSQTVRAIGTAFSVRFAPDNFVEVTVEEGRVAVARRQNEIGDSIQSDIGTDSLASTEVTGGQGIVVRKDETRLVQYDDAHMKRKMAWRFGVLAYAGEPLVSVVEDVSRYTNIQIEIADPTLRSLPVGGFFKAGEVDALLDALKGSFGIKVERLDEKTVRLSRAG